MLTASQVPDETWLDWASENTNWRNPEQYMQGRGTEDEPYLIDSPEDLAILCVNGAYDTDIVEGNGHFLQTANLYMSAYEWIAIPYIFGATYDGNGYTISGLISSSNTYYVNGEERQVDGLGLFGDIEGSVICNVNIKNSVFISQDKNVGGIIGGRAFYSTIKNCSVDAYISVNISPKAGSTNYKGIGGIVAAAVDDSNDGPWISNCCFTGTITGQSNGICHVGGIIGYTEYGGYAHISGSIFDGQIIMNGSNDRSHAGGIIGCASDSGDCVILNCIVKGVLKGYDVGGVCGYKNSYGGLSCSEVAVYATIDNSNSISNLFCGGSAYGGNACSFVGTVLGAYIIPTSVSSFGWDGCYAVCNGKKTVWCDDGTYLYEEFRVIPNINNGLPIQAGLLTIADVIPEPSWEEVEQWFADFEWIH